MFKGFELLKPVNVRFGGCQVGLGLGKAAGSLISFLLRDSVHFLQTFPTLGG